MLGKLYELTGGWWNFRHEVSGFDRSVRVSLRRRMAGEAVVRLRFDYFESQSDVRRKLVRWALDDASMIRDDEVEPPEIGNDRARDNWTPLLRIAGALSGDWPDRAMAAYAAMEATKDQDEPEEAGVMLLRDVREVMAERGVSEIAAASLLEALVRREERPWAEWRGDRPISARGVARLLRSFDIKSQRRSDARVYLGKDLDEAAQRYLPEPPAPSVTSVTSVTGGACVSEKRRENNALTLADGCDACSEVDGRKRQPSSTDEDH